MEVCAKRDQRPIILGDFNNFKLADHKNSVLKGYSLSIDLEDYVSMPKDNGTLHYIVAPSDKYSLKGVICSDKYVSDHRALFANIRLNS